MDIVVLSDTHLKNTINELPSNVIDAISNGDMLIHAGDFTSLSFYNSLKEITELKAVKGNMDSSSVKEILPGKRIIKINDFKIAIIHGNQMSNITTDKLSYLFPEADIIIFGHSHKPFNKRFGGQLFFNPGSSVQKRLQPDYSYGIISIEKEINSKIIRF